MAKKKAKISNQPIRDCGEHHPKEERDYPEEDIWLDDHLKILREHKQRVKKTKGMDKAIILP